MLTPPHLLPTQVEDKIQLIRGDFFEEVQGIKVRPGYCAHYYPHCACVQVRLHASCLLASLPLP